MDEVRGVAVPLGVNLPLPQRTLADLRPLLEKLPSWGYSDVWTGEGGWVDALTPLAAVAAWAPTLRVGTGVLPVQTRGAAVLAETAASLAQLATGGVLFGVGSSVRRIVSGDNGIAHERPYAHTRDMVRFLTRAFRGDDAGGSYETIDVQHYRLYEPPIRPPKVLVGALRPKMLNLGFGEADGIITNVLYPQDLLRLLSSVDVATAGKEVVVKLFVCPTTDQDYARRQGRSFLGSMLNLDTYRGFHRWLGREDLLRESHARWRVGDLLGAARAIPDEMVDALWIHGSPDACGEQIRRYLIPEVTALNVFIAPTPEILADPDCVEDVLRELSVQARAADAA